MNKLILFSLLLINSITLHGMLSTLNIKGNPQKTLGATLEFIIKDNNTPKNHKENDPVSDIITNTRFTHKQGPNQQNYFTESPIFVIVPKTTKKKFSSKL